MQMKLRTSGLVACSANGSVLNEISAGNYSAHAGLNICHDKVLDIVPRIRADTCPELTYADAIAVLGVLHASNLHVCSGDEGRLRGTQLC